MSDWQANLHVRMAEAIKRLRGARSAQWLADRTAELGYPMSRAQIANYESGRKKNLDVAELIVLAAALGTSPVNIVFPGPYDDQVELLPGLLDSEFNAAEWFSGIEVPESMSGIILAGEPWPNHIHWSEWSQNTAILAHRRLLAELEDNRIGLLEAGSDERVLKLLASVDDQIRLARQELERMYRDASAADGSR